MAAEYYSLEIRFQRNLFYIWTTDEACDRFMAEQGKQDPYLNGCHRLYDKIFWGSNLETLRDEKDPVYVPRFSRREMRLIRDVARRMFNLFADRLEA